jgi:zinc protease
VETYLATLPAAGRSEAWRNVDKGPPAGVVERTVQKGVEPKANTLLVFSGPFVYNPENRFALRSLVELFQIRLDQILREQLGGTYSPSIDGGGSRVPRQEYSLQIDYGSSPQNVDTLSRTVFKMIDSLKTFGPTTDEVAKVKEQLLRAREVQLKQNAYWLGNIAARDQAGEPLSGLLSPYDDMVKALTATQIQDAARKYFDTAHYAKFVLLPQ